MSPPQLPSTGNTVIVPTAAQPTPVPPAGQPHRDDRRGGCPRRGRGPLVLGGRVGYAHRRAAGGLGPRPGDTATDRRPRSLDGPDAARRRRRARGPGPAPPRRGGGPRPLGGPARAAVRGTRSA